MNEYFLKRKTFRSFLNKDINDELINQLIEAASHAPTTGNMQLYSVIVTRDNDKKNALAPAHFSQPAFVNAPVILTFCADFNRFVRWCEVSGADPGYDNFQSFMAALLDTAIFAQQFVTLAEMEGLGTCYLGTTTYNPDKIAEVLNLPQRVVPVITVAIGYPVGDAPSSDRLPLQAILHHEAYKDYSDDKIKSLYKDKEARQDSVRFVEENHKTNLAQVFTDIRYPRKNNELFSEVLISFLKKQNYL